MTEKVITLEELCNITKISTGVMRTYLGRYNLAKFLKRKRLNGKSKTCIEVNQEFVNNMSNFLVNVNKTSSSKFLQLFWDSLQDTPVENDTNKSEQYLILDELESMQMKNKNLKVEIKRARGEIKKLQEKNQKLEFALDMAKKQHEVLVSKYHEVIKYTEKEYSI